MGLTTNVVRGARAERLLVLIHGLGSDERDLAQLLPHLDPEGRFLAVMPRGPYSAPPGYAWFQFSGNPTLVSGTLRSSIDALDEAIDSACDLHGMPRSEAVLGGFSQGCMMALALAFREGAPTRPAGVLGMSGSLPPGDAVVWDWTSPPPAVLLQHGTHDPLIPVTRARQTAQTLAEHTVPLVYREYPMEHQVTLESVRDAKAWLDRVLAGEQPNEPLARSEAPPDELVVHVSGAAFDAEVLRSELPVVVDFWAPWCGPCRQVEPVIRQMAAMRKGRYKFAKVNIDEAPEIAQRYGIQSIPLVALFRNGRMERRSLGAKPRQQLEAELGMLVIP